MLEVSLVEEWIRESGRRFYKRLWSPLVLVWGMIYQRLNGDHRCDAVVSHLALGGADALDDSHREPVSERMKSQDTGGYCKARKRLPVSVLGKATRHISEVARGWLGESGRWLDHPVELLDGTTMLAYPHRDLVEHYGRHSNQHGETYWVLVRVVATFCASTGCARDVEESSMRCGEGHLAAALFRRGETNTVYVGDRNFGIFSVVQAARHYGSHVLVRLTDSRQRKIAGDRLHVGEDRLVDWAPSRKEKLHAGMSREPIPGRVLRMHVERPGFRPVELYLFTTLLDAERYPAEELVTLYGRRYHVEVNFRYVKTTLDMGLLNCKLVDIFRKELWAGLLAYNLIRGFMVQAAKHANMSPLALSFSKCWRRIREALARWCSGVTRKAATRLSDQLIKCLAKCELPRRTGLRVEPRAVRRRPRTFPSLTGSREDARENLRNQLLAAPT